MKLRIPDSWVRHIFEPLWDTYESSARLRTLRRLQKMQWQPLAAVMADQSKSLQLLVQHASDTSPFYSERFAQAGIDPNKVRTIADLAKLPLLSKDDIRNHHADIFSTNYSPEELVSAKTGGSTGVALQVFCDQQGIELRAGAALLADEWSGWKLGEPIAAVWGNPPVPITLKNKLRCLLKDRIIYLDTMRIDDAAIDAFLVGWQTMRPGMLYGHAHSIFILCEALQQRGVKLKPTGVVATSMMLIETERVVIEDVCGIKVTNRYGCEEVSLIACECEQHQGLHLNSAHNIVEFLREDGTPCDYGEDGRLVITELVNYGMPMIRYEVGDWGIPSDRVCSCGRGLPLMESVTGRTADFLVATDGSRVAGISIIENSLTKISGIRQMQIVQDKAHHLTVNVVMGQDYSEATAEDLVMSLKQMLGAEMQVDLNRVETIPQEKSGKYRFTKCLI
ncbi:MAG: phenylacetate-CoA ligase [Mariniblastus sp.]